MSNGPILNGQMVPRMIRVQYLRILLSSFGKEDFRSFALNWPYSNCLGHYFTENVGGATIGKNFNYTDPRTICMQYLRILLSVLEKKIFKGLD